MRLHALSIAAFGPFADTVEVDFDALADSGLFLLSGATGAGKSSVLDAVCFALYGEVAGDRSSAKRLRCDLAPDGVAPRVVLEVTLSGRRFRLTRSPAWQRPKKRGSGTTPQQAAVLVEELVGGALQPLTNRLDEAGQLVTELLGMNLSQFTQVVLLPQGRFQDFLRSKSEDRQRLLQQLFRTRRFEAVEHWLRDHRQSLRRASAARAEELAGLVHRLDEVGGRPLAEQVDESVLVETADDGRLGSWADGLASVSAATARTARASRTERQAGAEAATAELASGRAVAEAQARHRQAAAELDALRAEADEIRVRRRTLEAARRATPVGPLRDRQHRAEQALESAALTSDRALDSVRELVEGELGPDSLEAASEAAREAVVAARSLREVESELGRLTAEVAAEESARDRIAARTEELRARAGELPAAVDALEAEVAECTAAVGAVAEADRVIADLADRVSAATAVERLTRELAEARDELRAAVDVHQTSREALLALQERRISGMAAELATGLAVGDDCPVCGSCDHPRPASAAVDAPTAAAEKAARRAVDDADVTRLAHDDRVRTLETRLAVAAERAGAAPAVEVERSLASVRAERDRLAALAALLPGVSASLDSARAELERVGVELRESEVQVGVLTERISAIRERITARRATLTGRLQGYADVAALVAATDHQAAALGAALAAWRAHESARLDQALAGEELERVAGECGFDDVESAVAALRSTAEMAGHDAAVAEHDRRRAAAKAWYDDPELTEAAKLPEPDLTALTERQEAAATALSTAEAAHRLAVERAGRIEALRTQVTDALETWAPVRAAYSLASEMASFAEGKAADNALQMRLPAYVLSWRLGQVVDAANERLASMTDQRYALERSDRKGARETRGGLSLVVRDDWSGETRDPVTLSGGETFVVSLALALGLTDVVTQEAGGAEVGTLFVDEGFGSLDADTLDDVMDTLDALRDGGRVVGIVSHVPELRTRIPAQLHVVKDRSGSTLKIAHATG